VPEQPVKSAIRGWSSSGSGYLVGDRIRTPCWSGGAILVAPETAQRLLVVGDLRRPLANGHADPFATFSHTW
jgi:hypothetical protein